MFFSSLSSLFYSAIFGKLIIYSIYLWRKIQYIYIYIIRSCMYYFTLNFTLKIMNVSLSISRFNSCKRCKINIHTIWRVEKSYPIQFRENDTSWRLWNPSGMRHWRNKEEGKGRGKDKLILVLIEVLRLITKYLILTGGRLSFETAIFMRSLVTRWLHVHKWMIYDVTISSLSSLHHN